jgi:hypothetical protein
MKRHSLVPAAAALLVLLLCSCSDTTLVFQVQDSVSSSSVWDLSVTLQDRLLRSFYQTDAGPVPQKLTHLAPGPATLEVSAPGYEAVSAPVSLHPGRNVLSQPVRLVGKEIPGLAAFSVFETVANGDITVQLRPLDASGRAITHHPCLDLWIGCMVYEEAAGGVPVSAEGSRAASRGALLYRGTLPWTWDARPESLFRYSARLAASDLVDAPSLYRVIDYLVIVPDPTRISRAEIEAEMAGAWGLDGLVLGSAPRSSEARLAPALAAILDTWKGRARGFLVTSWDVRARQS